MTHHSGTPPTVRGGGSYTGNQQYRGSAGMRSCGRYGFICAPCTSTLAQRAAARQAPAQEPPAP